MQNLEQKLIILKNVHQNELPKILFQKITISHVKRVMTRTSTSLTLKSPPMKGFLSTLHALPTLTVPADTAPEATSPQTLHLVDQSHQAPEGRNQKKATQGNSCGWTPAQ